MEGRLNRIAALAPMIMSAAAIVLVSAALVTGWERGLKDEGAVAHTWQLLVGLQVPVIALYLATVNWKKPKRAFAIVAIQAAALVLALAPVAYFHL